METAKRLRVTPRWPVLRWQRGVALPPTATHRHGETSDDAWKLPLEPEEVQFPLIIRRGVMTDLLLGVKWVSGAPWPSCSAAGGSRARCWWWRTRSPACSAASQPNGTLRQRNLHSLEACLGSFGSVFTSQSIGEPFRATGFLVLGSAMTVVQERHGCCRTHVKGLN